MSKDKPKEYNCPACEGIFVTSEVKTNGGKCPHCDTPVKTERMHHKGHRGFYYTYILDAKAKLEQARPKKVIRPTIRPIETTNEKLISQPGAIPKIYQIGGERKYKVLYIDQIKTGWLYCPGCSHKMFQNTRVQSPVGVEQSHRCRRPECKADVTFIFRVSRPVLT